MSERNDPTEEPTARRWEKAFTDGQLAFSSELMGGLTVLVGVLFFLWMGRWFFDTILISIRERLTFFDPMISHPNSILLAVRRNIEQVGWACLALMVPIMVASLVFGFMQTKFNLSSKPLELKWDKMSPIAGFKRLFSTRAINRGGISIAKATAIVVVSYLIVSSRMEEIALSGSLTYAQMLMLGADLILSIGLTTAILMVVIGLVDLGFQIWKQKQDLMMTKQEVRDENKDENGDPQIKARIRRLQNEMARKRVIQEVPTANVVITNPTHFAVALRYEPGQSAAPVVVAKGADHLAHQIIRVAKENGVAVVERKPIARFLYAHVKIGGEIPLEMYQAVAEILNFIRRANRAA
ncbi:MAG: flagellar biosynthetic protein FlhB [Mariniblastus sp.]|jgi:flagellar biosynthetic protein FlhB